MTLIAEDALADARALFAADREAMLAAPVDGVALTRGPLTIFWDYRENDFRKARTATLDVYEASFAAEYRRACSEDAEVAAHFAAGALTRAQRDRKADADAEASRRRAAIVGTTDPAKLAVYEQKYAAVQSGDKAVLADEAQARGLSVDELATVIVTKGDTWRAAGFAFETAAVEIKKQIAALPDVASVLAFDVGAGWPEPPFKRGDSDAVILAEAADAREPDQPSAGEPDLASAQQPSSADAGGTADGAGDPVGAVDATEPVDIHADQPADEAAPPAAPAEESAVPDAAAAVPDEAGVAEADAQPVAYPGIALSIDQRKSDLSVIIGDMALDRAQASEDIIRNTNEGRLNHLLEMDLATDEDHEALAALYAAKTRVAQIYGAGLRLQRAVRDMDSDALDSFDAADPQWWPV
jgi:hypothetical protein